MRIIVIGAGGIIGQAMRLCCPADVEPVYTRTRAWRRNEQEMWFYGFDLTQQPKSADLPDPRSVFLSSFKPHAVINLAGENRPDVVERHPRRYEAVNIQGPAWLSNWCGLNGAHYVHVSTQAVFGGEPKNAKGQTSDWASDPSARPPYGADSARIPVNAYGMQKYLAEVEVSAQSKSWTIVRPTFVLGVRPMPTIGRQNPIEYWMSAQAPIAESQTVASLREVNDRWFSPSFAGDVAHLLWEIAQGAPRRTAVNVGLPISTTRYDLAQRLRTDLEIEPVSHDVAFPGLAPRPKDTTYAVDCVTSSATLAGGLDQCEKQYVHREAIQIKQRAAELSIFLGKNQIECEQCLRRAFGFWHCQIAEDWRKANPQTDDQILDWYRKTDAYLWELSAYHLDPGFNYGGMCTGIIDRLKADDVQEALCLGDGIGDMTIALGKARIHGIYHDLWGSRTAEFADFRQQIYLGHSDMACTRGWEPLIPVESGSMQAILSADFLEHVTDVEAWVRAIWDRLAPGGLFFAQSAFGMGSGANGSMPMHLACNDRFEKDWDPLLASIGFMQEASNWYRKPWEGA